MLMWVVIGRLFVGGWWIDEMFVCCLLVFFELSVF